MLDNKNTVIDNIALPFSEIDYGNLFFCIYVTGYPFIIYKTYKLNEVYKDFKINKPITIKKPPEIKLKEWVNNKKILKKQFGESIINFIKIVKEKLPHIDLNYLYKNVEKLTIIPISDKNLAFIKKKTGDYSIHKNLIRVLESNHLIAIDHELLHMASSVFDEKNKISYSGFHNLMSKDEIGRGINEGYTQLLTERYFSNENYNVSGSYPTEVHIARCLEWIIGKQMENMYFKADLIGLIKELEKYDTNENIIKFIRYVDFVSCHIEDNKYVLYEQNLIRKSLNEIFKFLLNCYFKKITKEIEQGTINYEHSVNVIYSFIDLIGPGILKKTNRKNYTFEFLSKEDIKNIIGDEMYNSIYNENPKIKVIN